MVVNDIIICNALYLLFGDFWYNMTESKKWKSDENYDFDYLYSFRMRTKAIENEDTIRKIWGSRCQFLLSGVMLYLYKLDPYFNPKLNDCKQFFMKIYRHREILTKIGSGSRKVIFPFGKLIKEKKLLLIRC